MIAQSVRQFVRTRAADGCEYCRMPQSAMPQAPFHVEHIVAKQHGGGDHESNLAFACERCNHRKGPNLSSIDPHSDEIVNLFHPRIDAWAEHFAINDGCVAGLTPTGRATVRLLDMNTPARVRLRRILGLSA